MTKLECHIYGVPDTTSGHSHPYAHILLPLAGPLDVLLGDEQHHITPQHLGFIAPGCHHHCLCDYPILMINIPAFMINKEDLKILSNQVCTPLTGELVPLVDLIKAEVRRNPDSNSVRYLYYYLYDKLLERNGSKSIRYIREHFNENISTRHLAQLENYNVSYFMEWFKKQTGRSPANYIRQMRIEKAKELLTTTHYRLIDVALQVGYQTGASFTRAFRELEGITPAAYRKNHQSKRPVID